MSDQPAQPRAIRVVVADDDPFTVSLVSGGLQAQGFSVITCDSIETALELVAGHDPHAIVTDLDFGAGGSGMQLVRAVHRDFPWVGLVILTAHRSPQLAVDDPDEIPAGTVYLVKSALRQVEELADAVHRAIAGQVDPGEPLTDEESGLVVLTPAQAEVLRMLAGGASTKSVAAQRGTTVRAAETMLTRLYLALGLEVNEQSNPRVEAVRLWQQGRVTVR